MLKTLTSSIAFLTYNDKVLLMLRDNRSLISTSSMWCFIEAVNENNESHEKTILREIEKETSLKLNFTTFLTTLLYDELEKDIYHITLTRENLNDIKRGEAKNLDFLTLQEVERLPLEKSIEILLLLHRNILEKILQN